MPQQTFSNVQPIAPPAAQTFSNVTPIEGNVPPKSLYQQARDSYDAQHGKVGMPGVSEGAGLAGGLSDWDEASFGEIGGGVKDILQGNIAKGFHRIITGGANALTPASPFAVAGAPVAAAATAAGGLAGGKLTRKAAESLGASPDQADLAEDIGSIAVGAGTAKAVNAIPRSVTTAPVRLAARSAETAINQKLVPVKPILNIMTPADEAEALNLKVPGRDYGLSQTAPVPVESTIPQTGESIQSGLARANANQPLDPYAAARKAAAPVPPAVGDVPMRPSVERVMPETSPTVKPQAVEQLLNEATGGKPLEKGIPLKNQTAAGGKGPSTSLPEGFTPVESSALKGYKYNAAKQELEVVSANGQHYIHGDVSPEQMSDFESADSKGKAWNSIRNSSTLVAKVVNGKRVAVKPAAALSSAEPPIEDTLNRMLQQVKAGKSLKDLQ